MKDENATSLSESLINIQSDRSLSESDSPHLNNVFINFDRTRMRNLQQNPSNTSSNNIETFHENNSSMIKSSSTSNLISNNVNGCEPSDHTHVMHDKSSNDKLNKQFSQQLKKDGYLLPIGYEDNSNQQVLTSSLSFPFPVPNDNALIKLRTEESPNESFEDSSASSSSGLKNHSYVNSINDVRYLFS
jgi:hypothetical protein